VEEFDDRLLIGEIYLPLERLMAYYGHDLRGAHLPFNFLLIGASWDAQGISRLIHDYETALPVGGWPNWVLGNHDKPRIASRIGQAQARVAAMLLLTLRGTPTMYYGDEIGMEDVHIPFEEVQDPFERNEPGKGLGRDPQRTPMQWNTAEHAGFSAKQPWLRLAQDWSERNVEALSRQEGSLLSLYRQLLALRRGEPALTVGRLELLPVQGNVLAYRRCNGGPALTVLLNLRSEAADYPLPAANQHVLLSTHLDRQEEKPERRISLRPNEGLILIER
jgi:alpha-glucosidase